MVNVFFDMDGTLARWNPNATLPDLYKEGYFLNLEPEESLCELANSLSKRDGSDLECYILTSVLEDSPYAKTEKIIWLLKHIPAISLSKIITVPYGIQKAHFVEDVFHRDLWLTDILVDDHSPNLIAWEQAGGKAIKWVNDVNNSCNSNFGGKRWSDPVMIERLIEQECEKMVETNIGTMPLKDYLEIVALQSGFDSYEDMLAAGYHIPD